MNEAAIKKLLYTQIPQELIDYLIENYKKSLSQYKKENWDYFGNDCGKFNETFFRILQFKLDGNYTPLEKKLPIFNDKILIDWENKSSSINETYRVVMPRILYSMFCIRNKRGMIHINDISPSKTDATLLIYNMKWLICELLRIHNNNNIDETMTYIEDIMSKENSLIWNYNNKIKILDSSINIKDKICILLYVKNYQSSNELYDNSGYSNKSVFSKKIKELVKDMLIAEEKGIYLISPKGIKFIEEKYFK